ncbi:MAG: hypothetical protein PWQ29_974 [Verrucomicrobiota bacterium]|jgi:ferredoxin|nr:hypothetical protein [Verrucomicrobiota bacterium]
MDIQQICSVFFSPTETTRMVVRAVARGTTQNTAKELDITLHEESLDGLPFGPNDLLVIGLPAYAGRIPGLATRRMEKLRGAQTPAVAITVYGNRAYDDALLELSDLCTNQGFKVIGAGAFIGKHSFSSIDHPIAHDRPDKNDIRLAEMFGQQIRAILSHAESATHFKLPHIPGNRPYSPGIQSFGAAGETDLSRCTQCGHCVAHCPSHAIRMTEKTSITDPDRCIWCTACVRNCLVGARKIALPEIDEIAARLYNTCQIREEPEWFLASVDSNKDA